MKVLILTDQFVHLNGAERLSIELAEDLNSRPNITADVASIYADDFPGVADAAESLRQCGVPNVHFLGLSPQPGLLSVGLAILRLRRLIREEGYDIVETSVTTPTIIACWATRGIETKHVAGFHFVFDRARDRGAKFALLRLSARLNKHVRFYAVSDYACRAWVDFSNTSAERTRTIYNGIPDESYHIAPDRESVRQELGIPSTGRIALFVGRIVKTKGIKTAIETLGPLTKKHGLYLVFVGPHEESIEGTDPSKRVFADEMMEFAVNNAWADHVVFTGRRNDVSRLMASSDVFLHPTQVESFGLVLVEAMAAGLPVVSSDVQGIPEVLKGTESFMISPDDVLGFRKAVLKVLELSPAEAVRWAELGRNKAFDFSMGKRANAILSLGCALKVP